MKTQTILLISIIAIISTVYSATAEDKWVQYTHGDYARAIAEEGDFLWIGTNGGLVKIHKTTSEKTFYNTYNSGLPSNNIKAIAIDRQGNKWIVTIIGGVAKYDGTNWTVYDSGNSGIPHNYVLSIAIDNQGNKCTPSETFIPLWHKNYWIVF
ncbi:MAG: hypothetical protein PF588_06770 [Candidatus Kapabacteria bacterium]|jgi:ligand-binding sensor domain-containing protein|nr:hypothetical protein [Candidatus Kapabacteria bacterium]